MSYSSRLSWLIFAVILAFWMWQTATIHESWNESTRLAAIESLVERGTWRIDASPYGHETGDKVLLDGHYYSDKPPLFAAIGAIFYAAMHYGLGATLSITGCQPGTWCVYYWLTVLMVGLPAALMVALFYRLAWRWLGSIGWALGVTALFCFGTIIWPYSLVFNHHLPAAAALFGAFYLLFDSPPRRVRVFGAGLFIAIAVMFDLTSFFLAMALFLIVVIYQRPYLPFFFCGALPPVIVTLIFNYQITGTPLFSYFFSQGYNFPGSQWPDRTSVAVLQQPDNLWLNSFYSLVGQRGMLAYSPLLWFAMAGLGAVIIKKNPAHLVIKSWLILIGLTGHLMFVLTQDSEFGGDNYGVRYLIPSVPILYAFIIFIIPLIFNRPQPGRFPQNLGRLAAILFVLAAGVSLFAAYQGSRGGAWHKNPPPFFLTLSSAFPYLSGQSNLALAEIPALSPRDRQPRHFERPTISQSLEVDLNNEVRLLGYDLPTRRIQPGQTLPLTLYWQSLRVAKGDYFIFSHLLDANQTRLGGLDRRLQEGYPVRFWYPGEVVTDERQIPVEVNAPNGLAWLRIGGYQVINNQPEALPLLLPGQAITETSLALGPIFIGKPQSVVSPQNFAPQHQLSINLGQPPLIALRGYTLTDGAGQPLTPDSFFSRLPSKEGQLSALKLTLYWESLAPTATDYTIFVHLRDAAGQTAAQSDGPPAAGRYPTSLWATGEIVPAEFSLTMPPNLLPGEYQLAVGLYDPLTGARLSVPGTPDNSVILTKITGN